MSFLEKTEINGQKQFYYDGARVIETLINAQQDTTGTVKFEIEYLSNDKTKDRQNVNNLKEELGTLFMEKQMYKQFTRNSENNVGDVAKDIKNNFQRELYKDFVRTNDFLAHIFLYFFHKFYWDGNVAHCKTADAAIGTAGLYKKLPANGLPSGKIIEEIKTVYPYMHNLFVKLLGIKYNDQANLALMSMQDAKEQLNEAELIGQIQKIKPKRNPKISLIKK